MIKNKHFKLNIIRAKHIDRTYILMYNCFKVLSMMVGGLPLVDTLFAWAPVKGGRYMQEDLLKGVIAIA